MASSTPASTGGLTQPLFQGTGAGESWESEWLIVNRMMMKVNEGVAVSSFNVSLPPRLLFVTVPHLLLRAAVLAFRYVEVVKEAMKEESRYFLEVCHDGPPDATYLPHSISFRDIKLDFGERERERDRV